MFDFLSPKEKMESLAIGIVTLLLPIVGLVLFIISLVYGFVRNEFTHTVSIGLGMMFGLGINYVLDTVFGFTVLSLF